MASTPREIVYQALQFEGPPRAPRQLWSLPWAEMHHGDVLLALQRDFPPDIVGAPGFPRETPPTRGDAHKIGEYVDEWGCVFENIQEGVIGEVKRP
ncbi:MAG TPA: methyltransferase, partial [Candidatus Hydrogenedentes bacterium]|nr:methyltransferase [Candidatus Hydrogenedentota bacterium]